MRFKRRGGSIRAELSPVEVDVLVAVVSDLLVLVGVEESAEADPLAAMVGLPGGSVERPSDPALARLLPDAYGEDEAAAAEFRRFTEAELRAGKRANATIVLATLAPLADHGGRLVLDRDEADAWLGCLNDVRLVLGTRLEVTEETDVAPLGDDPRSHALQVYGWLGWLQESLLSCLDPRMPR